MPCARMHAAILTSFAIVCAEGWVVEPGPGGPPAGNSFLHFACALLNAGDPIFPPPTGNSKPPPGFGSGKLGTPLDRMHSENASADGAPAPDRAVVTARAVAVVDAEVLALDVVAAVGLCELPPHPATRKPLTSAAAASRRALGERMSRCGWMLSCMWVSFCRVHAGAHRFYATGGFRSVSPLAPAPGETPVQRLRGTLI